ncbi:MAG: ArsC/Spx/MgsR family protein [Flavobacteriaceae bacterium]|nr:ArsC/Spx/MgsR family protein [Flavobacteriaceae bacterium]
MILICNKEKYMNDAIFYLKTCDTCIRIMKILNLPEYFLKINIKENPITENQLVELFSMSKSYEKLLNKRSRLFIEKKIKPVELKELEIKNLLLEHYTFLKRPIVIFNKTIYIGNSKNNINKLIQDLNE